MRPWLQVVLVLVLGLVGPWEGARKGVSVAAAVDHGVEDVVHRAAQEEEAIAAAEEEEEEARDAEGAVVVVVAVVEEVGVDVRRSFKQAILGF